MLSRDRFPQSVYFLDGSRDESNAQIIKHPRGAMISRLINFGGSHSYSRSRGRASQRQGKGPLVPSLYPSGALFLEQNTDPGM